MSKILYELNNNLNPESLTLKPKKGKRVPMVGDVLLSDYNNFLVFVEQIVFCQCE